MRLFRRHYSAREVGALLYEALRAAIASPSGGLSIHVLLEHLERHQESLPVQHIGEVVVGAMFSASLAVERSVPRWMSGEIVSGMRDEFLLHLREQGATDRQVAEWESVFHERFREFAAELKDYDGLEPPWKFGRRFLWSVVAVQDYRALSIKHATMFLLEARDRAQELINAYGPHISPLTPP